MSSLLYINRDFIEPCKHIIEGTLHNREVLNTRILLVGKTAAGALDGWPRPGCHHLPKIKLSNRNHHWQVFPAGRGCNRAAAANGMTVAETLKVLHDPRWRWTPGFYRDIA